MCIRDRPDRIMHVLTVHYTRRLARRKHVLMVHYTTDNWPEENTGH